MRGALIALLLASTAHGYVRTRSTQKAPGVPSYWPAKCVFMLPDNSTVTPDLPQDQVFGIFQKAIDNWLSADSSCSYLQITLDAPAAAEAHYDGTNVIKFRRDEWCHPIDDQNKASDPDRCYDHAAAAITSVFMINDGDPKDGLILDTDIEINNIDFAFLDIVEGQPLPPICNLHNGKQPADLENTVTHELGHVQGLSHTCRNLSAFAYDVDQNGNPPVACSTLPDPPVTAEQAAIESTTMFPTAKPCETKKRHPSADDLAGICNAYPAAMVRDTLCAHTDLQKYTTRSACSFGTGAPAWMLGLLVVPLLVLRRRRGGSTRKLA